MFQTSPIANLTPEISVAQTLCLADDINVAKLYLRGEGTHYIYRADWDSASLATESDIWDVAQQLGWTSDEFDGQPYKAMKNKKIRQALASKGFDGATYEDTHDGLNYETVELLRKPDGFSFALETTIEKE